METQNSENLTTIWLRFGIIKSIKVGAAMAGLTARDYMEELANTWIAHRKEMEGSLHPDFGYLYLKPPARNRSDEETGRQYSVVISQGAASFVRKYAFEDETSLSAVIYTILHYSLGDNEKMVK